MALMLIQEAAEAAAISAGDTAWVLMSSALVLVMVPGLALFYGGMVRGKSALNTMLMSIAALAVITVQWVVVGYSLAFGEGSRWLGDLSFAGLIGVGAEAGAYAEGIPHVLFTAFQGMFAGIAVALFSGAVVERMRFTAFLLFGVLWSTFVYDPLAHWVWGEGGWLGELGALDFAGGTVVHISAGVTAVVLAQMLGPRRDFGRIATVPHNVPFTLLGAGLLWFGWFGFNAGSALGANGVGANALLTTHAGASAGIVGWLLCEMWRNGRATAIGAATGAVVGLVAITPAAGFVTPLGALAIGVLSAPLSFVALHARAKSRLDDTLDVFACHGVAGISGALLTGVFATTAVNADGANGALYGNVGLLWIQLVAVVATMLFAGAASAGLLLLVRAILPVRVPVSAEVVGIDLSEHGEEAYHGSDLSDLAGKRVSLGEPVLLPARDVVFEPRAALGG
jgi:Amt family ammonium transporter